MSSCQMLQINFATIVLTAPAHLMHTSTAHIHAHASQSISARSATSYSTQREFNICEAHFSLIFDFKKPFFCRFNLLNKKNQNTSNVIVSIPIKNDSIHLYCLINNFDFIDVYLCVAPQKIVFAIARSMNYI